ncbi:MAG: hypothetical protein NC084_06185 [Bacteroides sp.]|nr:hypothetical protein [Eubacterium sp.]MCM1418186.1 hypothetical protein [Roseburia sp.]MCM1462289.1 hypothetical protein [Bacteroides sp.]
MKINITKKQLMQKATAALNDEKSRKHILANSKDGLERYRGAMSQGMTVGRAILEIATFKKYIYQYVFEAAPRSQVESIVKIFSQYKASDLILHTIVEQSIDPKTKELKSFKVELNINPALVRRRSLNPNNEGVNDIIGLMTFGWHTTKNTPFGKWNGHRVKGLSERTPNSFLRDAVQYYNEQRGARGFWATMQEPYIPKNYP